MKFCDFTQIKPTDSADLKRMSDEMILSFSDAQLNLWNGVRQCDACRNFPQIRDVVSTAPDFKSTRINGYCLNVENPLGKNSICLGKYIGLGKTGTVMFIGMNPGTNRTDGDKALDGDARSAGGILQNMIREVTGDNDPFHNFYFTDLVKCSTLDNKLEYNDIAHREIINNCAKFLIDELLIVKPLAIVLLVNLYVIAFLIS
jgi:uracil-DNA glycosylase